MASEYFLKVDGIAGESQDQHHKGEIDLESFSWGETHPAAAPGAAAAGKVHVKDFQVMKRMDKASPLLMLAAASGQHFKSAVLTARKSGGLSQEYLTITLGDVMVSSYQTETAEDPVPVDQVSFTFGRIEIVYRPQRPDGTFDTPVSAGWDVTANHKI